MSAPSDYNPLLQALPIQLAEFFKAQNVIFYKLVIDEADIRKAEAIKKVEKELNEFIIGTVNAQIATGNFIAIQRIMATLRELPVFNEKETKPINLEQVKTDIKTAIEDLAKKPKATPKTREEISSRMVDLRSTQSTMRALRYNINTTRDEDKKTNWLISLGQAWLKQDKDLADLKDQPLLSEAEKKEIETMQAQLNEVKLSKSDLLFLNKKRDELAKIPQSSRTAEQEKMLATLDNLIMQITPTIPVSILPADLNSKLLEIDEKQLALEGLRIQSKQDPTSEESQQAFGIQRLNQLKELGEQWIEQRDAINALKQQSQPLSQAQQTQLSENIKELEAKLQATKLDQNEIDHWLGNQAKYLEKLDTRTPEQEQMLQDLNKLIPALGGTTPQVTSEVVVKPAVPVLSANAQAIQDHFQLNAQESIKLAQELKQQQGDIPTALLKDALTEKYPQFNANKTHPMPEGNMYNINELGNGIVSSVAHQFEINKESELAQLSVEGKSIANAYYKDLEEKGIPSKPDPSLVVAAIAAAEQKGKLPTVESLPKTIQNFAIERAATEREAKAATAKAEQNKAQQASASKETTTVPEPENTEKTEKTRTGSAPKFRPSAPT